MDFDSAENTHVGDSAVQEAAPRPVKSTAKTFLNRLTENKTFSYVFMISLLVYIILCGYVLVFSGSLFAEAVMKGWYKASAAEYDSDSFLLGYLYGFPSLLGLIGGFMALSSKPHRFFKFKVLLFFPSFFWSVILVLDIVRWGAEYWIQWLYLIPIFLLCGFVFFCIVRCAPIPYHTLPKAVE